MFPREFRPVCRYVMRDGKPQDVEILDQELWRQSGAVYARVYGDKVVYIGATDGKLWVGFKRQGVERSAR